MRIAEWAAPVSTLGPGKRFVIWLQGCCFDCKGCTSPEWQLFEGGANCTVEEALDIIMKAAYRYPDLTGITFSGGEPMLQAGEVLNLWESTKKQLPNWNLMVYTGFCVEEIQATKDVSRVHLAEAADILIDGKYNESLNDGKGLRGSSNQRIIIRSSEHRSLLKQMEECERVMELRFRGAIALFAGVPPKGFNVDLDSAINSQNGKLD